MKARSLAVLGPRGFINLAYGEWEGPPGAPTVLCVHGLTRNSRDFDFLAQDLSARFRVVCPDMPGRGRSDWLDDAEDYAFPFYLAVLAALYARVDVPAVHWVGTSMGGLIGILFAALPKSPVRRLVLNDVGPVIAAEGLARIGKQVGGDPGFSNRQELEQHVRQVYAGFGPLTEPQWRHIAAYSGRTRADGKLGLAYDPKIGDAFRAKDGAANPGDLDLWPFYDQIRCPTLILRGADSDILRQADAVEMSRRGPRAEIIEFAGVGHAPALMAEDQIAAVRDFLLAG